MLGSPEKYISSVFFLKIENHQLLVIATDSFAVQPQIVDAIYSTSGERFDFVVNASKPNIDQGMICFKYHLKR